MNAADTERFCPRFENVRDLACLRLLRAYRNLERVTSMSLPYSRSPWNSDV